MINKLHTYGISNKNVKTSKTWLFFIGLDVYKRQQLTKAKVKIDPNTIGGLKVAERVALLSKIGYENVYRCLLYTSQTTLGHVEAGLRTWNKYSPFPEEMNRQMTDDLADLYFAPTEVSKANLLKENHPADNIFVTGNTAIDALHETVQKDYHHDVLDEIKPGNKVILVTMHRRENQGEPMRRVDVYKRQTQTYVQSR